MTWKVSFNDDRVLPQMQETLFAQPLSEKILLITALRSNFFNSKIASQRALKNAVLVLNRLNNGELSNAAKLFRDQSGFYEKPQNSQLLVKRLLL
jgi:hypothetical protein